MTFFTLSIAIALASPQPPDCALLSGSRSQRTFTNADLERMAACRYQTGAQSEVGTDSSEKASRPDRRATKTNPSQRSETSTLEADWRAQWRSIDQKARRLRSEARELRQEATEAPRDPKKQTIGRRSPSLLITRARRLETEAKELEDEFQDRARREGALPGWLRGKAR